MTYEQPIDLGCGGASDAALFTSYAEPSQEVHGWCNCGGQRRTGGKVQLKRANCQQITKQHWVYCTTAAAATKEREATRCPK